LIWGEGYIQNLKGIIINSVKKIFNRTVQSNEIEDNHPMILSENDLCFHFLREIYDKTKYEINTEVKNDEHYRPYRHNIVIYDKSKSKYLRTNPIEGKGNPKYWGIKHYKAVIEVKYNFSYSPRITEGQIFEDLTILSDVKNMSDSLYLIMFDMKGNHTKHEQTKWLEKQECKNIIFLYGDIKNNRLYENGRLIF